MLNLKLLLFIVAAIAALGLIFGLGTPGDDPEPDDYYTPDASEVAAWLSSEYSGFFGDVLYLADGETKAEATDFYPNGSSRSPTENYVTFKALADKDAAKKTFEAARPSYESQVGRTVMGSVVAGTEVKGNLDDAFGYYNNFNMGTPSAYLYYMGYYGNVFFESYFYLTGAMISEIEISDLAKNIYKAIKNPISVDYANRYVKTTIDYGGTLLVYGNANMDSVIDSNDIVYVQKAIKGEVPKTDYCDANNDGVVDSKDVSYIQDLIAYKDGTIAYYTDGNGVVSHATFPVKKIVAYGSSSAQLFCLALGLDSNTVIQYDTWPSTTPEGVDLVFQNFAGAGTVTSGSLDNFSDVVKDGLPDAVVISYQYASDPTVLAPYAKAGIDIIPIKGFEGAESADTALILGFLLDRNDEAKTFAQWSDGILTELNSKLATLKEEDKPTALYWFGGQAIAGKDSASDILPYVGAINVADWTEWYLTLTDDNKDWILNYPCEYFFKTVSQGLGYGATDEMRATQYNFYSQRVTEHPAYKAGHFVLIDGNMPQIMRLAYVAEYLHPDLLGEGFADRWHQQLVDMYGLDYDVSEHIFLTTLDNLNGNDVVPPKGADTLLTVLGNADLDDDIDSDDVKAVESAVKMGATVVDYPYCDANNDGAVDQKDVQFVKDMVAKKKQVIYYYNVDGEIASVHYPVTGTIIATYNKTLEAVRTLGLSSQVIAIDDFSYEWPTYFPEFMNLPSIGSRFTPSVEKVLDLDADAYLCGTKKWFAATLETDIGSSDMDVIRLPTWEEGQVLSGMITLGYITQHEEQAKEYIEWADSILSKVEDAIGDKADSDKPTVLVLDAGKPLSTKKAGSGQYENSVRAGGYNIVKDIGSEEEYYTNLTMEWILNKDPDFIVFSQSSTAYQWNDANLQEALDNLKKDFALTTACDEGRFHILNLEVFIGPSYPIGVLYMAKWFYPEELADVDVSEYLQDYIDRFCGLDMDVVEHGGFAL